jgi:hypothetical protein
MKTLLLVVMAAWAGVVAGHARLGESEADAAKRYGPPQTNETTLAMPPLLPGAVEHAYFYEGWLVRAAYLEGRTEKISYQHGTGRALAEAEVTTLLDAERGERTWKDAARKERREKDPLTVLTTAVRESVEGRVWERGDRARACLRPDGCVLVFESRKAQLQMQKAERSGKSPAPAPPKL